MFALCKLGFNMDWRHLPPLSALRAFSAFAQTRNVVAAGEALEVLTPGGGGYGGPGLGGVGPAGTDGLGGGGAAKNVGGKGVVIIRYPNVSADPTFISGAATKRTYDTFKSFEFTSGASIQFS